MFALKAVPFATVSPCASRYNFERNYLTSSLSVNTKMVHPLLLPNILDNIFCNFLPVDLKLLRLVNIDWNHAACIAISKTTTINFYSSESLKRYESIFTQSIFCPHNSYNVCYKICEEGFRQIQNFFENYPRQNIRTLYLTLGSDFLSATDFVRVLNLVSKSLEYLGLRSHYFKCPELEELNSRIEIPPLLCLQGITIEVQSYEDKDDWDCITNFLCSIFQAAPNLVAIHHPLFCVPPTKCRVPSRMNIYLTRLILEERLQISNPLACLNFITKLNKENIQALLNKKFPLRHLYINMWVPDEEELCVTPPAMKSLMAQLSPTLEKLGLDLPWRRDVAYEFSFQFPMKNLMYLSLSGFQGSLVGLLNKAPNLNNIELSQLDLLEILPGSQISGSYSTVTRVRLDFCMNQVPGALSRLSRIFPNLRCLNVNHTTDDICRMIFKKMLNLSCLRLEGDELTDEALTGIPSQKAKENKLISSPIEIGNSLRCFAFIGDLPSELKNMINMYLGTLYHTYSTGENDLSIELRELKLEAYRLTEACIKHGIVHCISLEFVSMDTRLEKNDPSQMVTRTFRLSDYGKRLAEGQMEGTLILKEELEGDEDEDAEKFFRMYEIGMVTDLLFS